MREKSKKNQTIQYYDQNAADFVENTRNVDFHVMQDEFIEGLPAGAKILHYMKIYIPRVLHKIGM